MIRCPLFVPADSQKKLQKAIASNADCLFIDLEDSITPTNKQLARQQAKEFLQQQKNCNKLLYVRINDLQTQHFQKDLETIMTAKPHGIVLPKSQSGKDVAKLDTLLRVEEAKNNIADNTTRIVAIITETALAILQAEQYINCSKRLEALAWGGEDIIAELGVANKRDQQGNYTKLIEYAKIKTLLGAAAAKVRPLDGIYENFKDDKGLETEARQAYYEGFKGKMAIHPQQIDIIKKSFTPTQQEITTAKKIIAAFNENSNGKNFGTIALEGKMLDKPHLLQAQNILKEIP